MSALLLGASALLGALSFFEPCTIATHTLFAVRTRDLPQARSRRSLLTIWLSRSLLCVVLLAAAVLITPPLRWGPYLPSAILAGVAAVYVVSRFRYLPIPHLEFHRLLPGGRRLSDASRLGLTLPACTIPLFLVVAGLSVTVDAAGYAIGAGLLFAACFTLPVAVIAVKGLHAGGRDFLQRAATVSPYFTAALLLGGALYLLM